MTRQQDNPFYDEHSQYSDRYQPPNQPSSPVYDVALTPDHRPLFSPQSAPSGSVQRDHKTPFTDVGGSLNITANSPPGSTLTPPRTATNDALYQSSAPRFLKRGPPHTSWGSESIPSLPHIQEKSHFETTLV